MTNAAPLDLTAVRAAFPALADGWAYLDNAGGSLVLGEVAARVSDYLLTTSVQTGASYEPSRRASARLREARVKLARLVNAARPEEIVLAPSTTAAFRALAEGMAHGFQPGDEVVLTSFDHESNIGPWLRLRERGVAFRTWHLNPETLAPDLADLGALMTPRTRLVCVTHASNILGAIVPVAEIAAFVHERGARIAVDAVAYAPHRAIDVRTLDVDYLAFSFYKTYGPHFALLYGKHDLLAELDGLYHYFYGREVVPGKLEPGNPNYELAWGCTAIVDYLDALGGGTGDHAAIARAFEAIAAHEEALSEALLGYLRGRNDVEIVGPREASRGVRVPTVSFRARGRDPAALVAAVDGARVGIRHGDFHSRRLIEHLRLAQGGGVLRASLAHYNTVEEVHRLTAALDEALGAD